MVKLCGYFWFCIRIEILVFFFFLSHTIVLTVKCDTKTLMVSGGDIYEQMITVQTQEWRGAEEAILVEK